MSRLHSKTLHTLWLEHMHGVEAHSGSLKILHTLSMHYLVFLFSTCGIPSYGDPWWCTIGCISTVDSLLSSMKISSVWIYLTNSRKSSNEMRRKTNSFRVCRSSRRLLTTTNKIRCMITMRHSPTHNIFVRGSWKNHLIEQFEAEKIKNLFLCVSSPINESSWVNHFSKSEEEIT